MMNDIRIPWVHGSMVLRRIPNEALVIREGDIRWCCTITLVVGYDFNAVIYPDTKATKI